MNKLHKYFTVFLLIILMIFSFGCHKEDDNIIIGGHENEDNNATSYLFTVIVNTIDLQPVEGFEMIDTKGNIVGKTDKDGKFNLILKNNKFFYDAYIHDDQNRRELNIDFIKPKSLEYKYVTFGYTKYETIDGTNIGKDFIVYYVDNINSENILKHENFVEFSGPIVLYANTNITDGTKAAFLINDKIVGYSELNTFIGETGYLFRHIYVGTVIKIEYETENNILNFIYDDGFNKLPLINSLRIDKKLTGYRLRLVLKDKNLPPLIA